MFSQIKRSLILFAFLLSAHGITAASLTLRTATILDRAQAASQPSTSPSPAPKSATSDKEKFSVMLSLSPDFDISTLANLGLTVGTHVANVATTRATSAQLLQLATLDGVQLISADNRVHPRLNIAVPMSKADSASLATLDTGDVAPDSALRKIPDGEGVVVGIVDWDFDLSHPAFYDAQGNIRVAKLWVQNDDYGKCPSYYGYGSVYSPMEGERSTCVGRESHGTHTAAIAAGSGSASGMYKGVAPGATLVLVSLPESAADADILNAVGYVFRYAQSVGKPAVVNLSIGMHYGPHDGTSAFDRGLDALCGEGRIAVGAAGNEGSDFLHARHTFSATAGTVRTVMEVSSSAGTKYACAYANIGQQFEWTIEVWERSTASRLYQANGDKFYSTERSGWVQKRFIATRIDTVSVSAQSYSTDDANNSRGRVEIAVRNTNPYKYAVVLVLKASRGTVNIWGDGDCSLGTLSNSQVAWLAGNNECSVGEIGGTSKSIISVGSYTIRAVPRYSYTSDVGRISYFSSVGPTADGRQKPELIAPGCMLYSAVSSCDYTYTPQGLNSSLVDKSTVDVRNGTRYYYGLMQGTSMAAPMVAGAVALLLQRNPHLTPAAARSLLQRHATVDDFISDATLANARGAGKLNVLGALQIADRDTTPLPVVPMPACGAPEPTGVAQYPWQSKKPLLEFSLSPNPSSGAVRIASAESGTLAMSVFSMLGELLYTAPVLANSEVQLGFLPKGLYVVQLKKSGKVGTQKLLLY